MVISVSPGRTHRSFRRLLAASGVGLFLLLAAGAGLTWRIVAQERVVALERSRQQLEGLADLVAATLRGTVAELDQAVATLAAEADWAAVTTGTLATAGVVAFLETSANADVRPPDTVLFRPWVGESTDDLAAPFRRADQAELVQRAYSLALTRLRGLRDASDPRIRAGALVRVARIERKQGNLRAAEATYRMMEGLDATPVGGAWASLIGLHGRCSSLAALGERAELLPCASTLRGRLFSGHWLLSKGAFSFYRDEVERWLAESGPLVALSNEERQRLEASSALDLAWRRARQDDTGQDSGRASVVVEGSPVLLLWRRGERATAGMAATAAFFLQRLTPDILPAVSRRGAALRLTGADGVPLLELGTVGSEVRLVRSATEMRAPWTLTLSAGIDRESEFSPRRWFVPGVFLVGMLVVLGASYAAFRALRRELEVARIQSEFVAAVSHEFRSPLAALRQMSEMLNEGRVRDQERGRRYLQAMEHETKRLQRLVDGLLDFGKMEAGVQEFRMERVDAVDLVSEVVEEFRLEPVAEGREIRLESIDGVLPVKADRAAFSRVIWNLLDNAVKYSPGGGAIEVRVERRGLRAVISVADHGIGIDAEDRRRIFDRFVRGRGAAAASVRGTGLGLAMVQRIVSAHGGEVTLESLPERGSTFSVIVPAAAKEVS